MDAGATFMELHRSGTFVMVNVADAGTARAVCEAGAVAVATTSGGHAATLDRRDAAGEVTMEEHARHTEVIVRAASDGSLSPAEEVTVMWHAAELPRGCHKAAASTRRPRWPR